MDYSKLLQPLKTRCFTLKNRMIFSPVAGYMATHNGYCDASTIGLGARYRLRRRRRCLYRHRHHQRGAALRRRLHPALG